MPDEYLWPARNVAEHAYCPRLFYILHARMISSWMLGELPHLSFLTTR